MKTPDQLLTDLENKSGCTKIIPGLWNNPELRLRSTFGSCKGRPHWKLAEQIVSFFGEQLLAQKAIRDALLDLRKPSDKLIAAFNARWLSKTGKKLSRAQNDWKEQLYPKWHAGGPWAHEFCKAYDLDPHFAGYRSYGTRPQKVEELEAHEPLTPLLDFQKDLSDRIYKSINKQPAERAMATLPTGAGKTRTMIDAILRFQREREGIILWVATTAEVCEQASQAYRRSYENSKPNFGSAIHRFWGSYDLDSDFTQGLLVAGVQKLRAQIETNRDLCQLIKDHARLVVFDEAHHATAPTYKKTLDKIHELKKRPRIPMVGLTATPGKGVVANGDDVAALVKFFDANLLQPKKLKSSANPLRRLQSEGVLSKLIVKRRQGAKGMKLSNKDIDYMLKFSAFSPELLHKIGRLQQRNKTIIQSANPSQKTLVFACDIDQAHRLAYEWREKYDDSRISKSITSETPYALRRKWLEEFMDPNGALKIIVNVGVLTTGFDAPKVERLILARPTMSRILFEQMVGRGMRGPRFGGYTNCTVIDIVDNFTNFGTIKSAKAFEKNWLLGKRLKQ